MSQTFQKIMNSIIFNLSLFLILMVGIQNNNSKEKVNLLINETISLPISFIVGISFISGSITGSVLPLIFLTHNKRID